LLRAAGPAHTHFVQYEFKRAKVRERRLQKVESYEGSEPKPILAVIVRQDEAQEDKDSGEPPDD